MFSKFRLKSFLTVSLTCIALAPWLGVSAAEKSSVRFRVLTVERSAGLKEIFLIKPDGTSGESIRMHKNNFSGPYHAKGRKLVFSRAATAGDEKPEIVGQVSLSEGLGKRVLLVAVASAKGYAFYPMSDNLATFGAGKSKFVNLTNTEIAGIVNTQKIKISPVRPVRPWLAAGNRSRTASLWNFITRMAKNGSRFRAATGGMSRISEPSFSFTWTLNPSGSGFARLLKSSRLLPTNKIHSRHVRPLEKLAEP